MLDILKEILLDNQEAVFETGVPRHLQATPVPGKATVCIGVRRCGKSTWLYQRMRQLQEAGVPRENILSLNFFDDRLHFLQHEGLALVTDAYFSLYPEKKGNETVYCFFDEIQAVPGWEPFVDRLLRTEKCELYLTGSSARMLSRELATQMRGRALAWELFPFSFAEFLDARGIDYRGELSGRQRLHVQKAFDDYWQEGGFPEVNGLDRQLRVRIHQEYFNAVLFRDLVERHDVAHPRAVSDLAHWLVDNVASLYTVNRLTGYLKSLGHKVPKASVGDYLAWFEDAYFLFSVHIHDASLARARTNPKKIYCIDHALVESVASGILVNAGHRLENLVFTALRRQTPRIHYYRTRHRKEVDFIALRESGPPLLVQVCESLRAPQTRKRELAALEEAMEELGLAYGLVVTRSEAESLEVGAGAIEVLPAWRFLLTPESATLS
ncbi:MAG TPA: ATP-binding protein [Thiotrichales bacterium]|nr:ATP-binding protein [Thiotrichales bacterium]